VSVCHILMCICKCILLTCLCASASLVCPRICVTLHLLACPRICVYLQVFVRTRRCYLRQEEEVVASAAPPAGGAERADKHSRATPADTAGPAAAAAAGAAHPQGEALLTLQVCISVRLCWPTDKSGSGPLCALVLHSHEIIHVLVTYIMNLKLLPTL